MDTPKALIKMKSGQTKAVAVAGIALGTETLDTSVPAGYIGIYVNGVVLNTGDIDRAINALRDALREKKYLYVVPTPP